MQRRFICRRSLPGRALASAGRCGCYAGRRHVSDEADAATRAVFSADASSPIKKPNEACEVAADADQRYATISAKIEYCRSRGVDYERAVRCASTVRMLERIYAPTTARTPASASSSRGDAYAGVEGDNVEGEGVEGEDVEGDGADVEADDGPGGNGAPATLVVVQDACIEALGDGSVRVRVVGMTEDVFMAMERVGRCPLCRRRGHGLKLCPHLPDDLRPFC